MEPGDFIQAVRRIARDIISRARLLKFNPEWEIIQAVVGDNVIQATDWLFDMLDGDEDIRLLARFLRACRVGQDSGPPMPTAEQVADLWEDCLAVAYHLLVGELRNVPMTEELLTRPLDVLGQVRTSQLVARLRLVAALEDPGESGDMLAPTSLAFPGRSAVWQRYLDHPEHERLRSLIAAGMEHRDDSSPLRQLSTLLAVAWQMLADEVGPGMEPVWVLAAGDKGGVGQLSVFPLRGPSPRVELALWSRYRLDSEALASLVNRLGPLLPRGQVRAWRVVFNPPNVWPAAPVCIRTTVPQGASIEFAFALAAYAASERIPLGRYAVTGSIGPQGEIEPVSEIAEKLRHLAAHNASTVVHVTDVLLPQANMTQTSRRLARELGLTLNHTLQGPITITQLKDVLQPGVLYDQLLNYVEHAVQLYADQVAAASASERVDPQDWALAQVMADRVLDEFVFSAIHRSLELSGDRGVLWPVPHGLEPRYAVAYVAASLARRRLAWATQLATTTTHDARASRPPTPVVLSDEATGHVEEAALAQVRRVSQQLESDTFLQAAWRSLPREFALILTGTDDLVARLFASTGGLASQRGGNRAHMAPQLIMLIADSFEQMRHWGRELEAIGETLQRPLDTWYSENNR
ncbi:MAG: hypothetical protein U0822_09930 [Anaerolineae bacterium]